MWQGTGCLKKGSPPASANSKLAFAALSLLLGLQDTSSRYIGCSFLGTLLYVCLLTRHWLHRHVSVWSHFLMPPLHRCLHLISWIRISTFIWYMICNLPILELGLKISLWPASVISHDLGPQDGSLFWNVRVGFWSARPFQTLAIMSPWLETETDLLTDDSYIMATFWHNLCLSVTILCFWESVENMLPFFS